MGKPDAPTPPDPLRTAAAQTGTNVSTSVANAYLNNTNQITPDGSLNYNQSGSYAWTDPSTGSTYNIPTFTATQTLSPQGQAIKAQTLGAQYNMAGMANAQSGRISNLLSNEMNLGGAPAAGNASSITGIPGAATSYDPGGPIQSSIGGYGQQQTTFGDAGDITRSYGPQDNFSADRQRVEDSLMARMNPQLAIERNSIEQRLADQGIRYGSQAYTSAMDDYNRQANDARYGAIQGAGQEQQRMTQEAAAQAAFQNSAQGQAYSQAQGRGQFANEAQGQNFQQALGAGTFANQAQGQQNQQNAALASFGNAGLAQQLAQGQSGFNAQNASRNQYMQEQYAQRNQPINEITSLLSGSQVNNPNFVNTPGSQIATTDVGSLINQNFAQQSSNYQQQNSNYQSLMGGILGLGAGALKGGYISDRREKEDIVKMATVFAADDGGERKQLPIYEYSYKKDPASTRHVGPMAQDVERITPEAVSSVGGIKYIKPAHVIGSILRAA
jgi:hypothetical protein